jgi:mannose-6-phosphate isomerase
MTSWRDIVRLECGIQHYSWGAVPHRDHTPFIADLLGIEATPGKPYAELWIGAHADLPSLAITAGGATPLHELIEKYPRELLGDALLQAGFTTLPFLLKILSCRKALSIQAHPDSERARQLHRRAPEHYPDTNHKPEIAVAVTDFEALCQFRPENDLLSDLARISGLQRIAAAIERTPADRRLRQAYAKLLSMPERDAAEALDQALEQVRNLSDRSDRDECFLRIAAAYPGDRGALSVYFLNHVRLSPGEAVFLGANEPHAYLQGTIVECMANSNNVVRGGLTSKFVDKEVLLEMLTYRAGKPTIMSGTAGDAGLRMYAPPVQEFKLALARGPSRFGLRAQGFEGPVLALVLEGNATFGSAPDTATIRAGRGTAWLIPAAIGEAVAELDGTGDAVVIAGHNMERKP